MCDALLTPADISEQTESIRAKCTRGLNCNCMGLNGGIWTAKHISPSFWLQHAAVAITLGSLVASEMYDGANVSPHVQEQDTGQTSMGQ